MALIVEDGTIVANANSYESLANIRAYATARGVTLPVADADAEVLVLKAMDYLESQPFQGYKYTKAQSLQWPREGAVVDGFDIDYNEIPQSLKSALCECVIYQNTADLLQERSLGIVREKVDSLEVEYEKGASSASPVIESIRAKLVPLLKPETWSIQVWA